MIVGGELFNRHRGIKASRHRAEERQKRKHPQITQITQIFLEDFKRKGIKKGMKRTAYGC